MHDYIDAAIDAAIEVIQAALGQTDGGFAAHYLTGDRYAALHAILTDYAEAERDYLEAAENERTRHAHDDR